MEIQDKVVPESRLVGSFIDEDDLLARIEAGSYSYEIAQTCQTGAPHLMGSSPTTCGGSAQQRNGQL